MLFWRLHVSKVDRFGQIGLIKHWSLWSWKRNNNRSIDKSASRYGSFNCSLFTNEQINRFNWMSSSITTETVTTCHDQSSNLLFAIITNSGHHAKHQMWWDTNTEYNVQSRKFAHSQILLFPGKIFLWFKVQITLKDHQINSDNMRNVSTMKTLAVQFYCIDSNHY